MPVQRINLALALAASKRTNEAIAALEQMRPPDCPDFFVKLGQCFRFALQGQKEKLAASLNPELVTTARRDLIYSYYMMVIYAVADEREQAFDWLENAVSRGWINYPYLSEYDPFLAKFRSDPRFQKLMVRVRGEWGRFEP